MAHGKAVVERKPNIVTIRKQGKSAGQRVSTVINGSINDPRDLSATWYSSWDDENLYVWVNVQDDRHVNDSPQPWADDSVEIYIDADGSRSLSYDGKNDYHIIYQVDGRQFSVSANSAKQHIPGVKQEVVKKAHGYELKTAIPWRSLDVKPNHGKRIGFDVQINDDDTGQNRDAKLAWNAKSDIAWKNPQTFGQLLLAH